MAIKIECKIAGKRPNLGQRQSPNSRCVFFLSDIADIMHFVFHTPIAANPNCKLLSGFVKRANVVANLGLPNQQVVSFDLVSYGFDPN